MRKDFLLRLWIVSSVICFVLFVVLIASNAHAQEWHTANQTTVAWDMSDGATMEPPIPQAEISYYVYLANAVTDPNKDNPTRIGETPGLDFTVTLNSTGRYFVGVSAIRTVEGQMVGESDISWSTEATPPFGIQFYNPPAAPGGIRVQ